MHGDLCHGLYARKGLQIRKVSDNRLQQAINCIPFFKEDFDGFRKDKPSISVNKAHDDYCKFVHFAILEALWVDGEAVDDGKAIQLLDNLDNNTD